MNKLKGFRTVAISSAVFLGAIIAFLQNTNLPKVLVDLMALFNITVGVDQMTTIVSVLLAVLMFVMRMVTDTPVWFKRK